MKNLIQYICESQNVNQNDIMILKHCKEDIEDLIKISKEKMFSDDEIDKEIFDYSRIQK